MTQPHRDRSLALSVVGGLEVLAGLGLFGLAGLTAVAAASPDVRRQLGGQAGGVLAAVALYALLGVSAIVVGGGLIAFRRWARALSLIASVGMVVLGLLMAVTYAVLGPTIFSSLPAQAGAPSSVVLTTVVVGFSLAAFVVPGAACAAVLHGEDARLTVEWRDRQERWTDRCPLPVLGLVMLHVLVLPALVVSSFTSPALLAGRILTGPAAVAFYLLLAAVLGVLAWGLYRLRPWALLAELALTLLGFLNALSLMRRDALREYYRALGMPEEQVALSMRVVESPALLVVLVLAMGLWIGWLLLLRKHFRRSAA